MTDKRISELTSITGAGLADGDLLTVVDVSDTTMAASGTNKKITKAELASAVGGSGAATVHSFLFAVSYNASGLSNGSGYLLTTVGPSGPIKTDDQLVGFDVVATTAFDGTTPKFDFGGTSTSTGNFGWFTSGPLEVGSSEGMVPDATLGFAYNNQYSYGSLTLSMAYAGYPTYLRFLAGDLYCWVTQDGLKNGASPGSTAGNLEIVITVARP